jgi:hypothetical protein
MGEMAGERAPIGADELDAIEQRADCGDVARLVGEVRRLTQLAEERGDEILRLCQLLDDREPATRNPKRTA